MYSCLGEFFARFMPHSHIYDNNYLLTFHATEIISYFLFFLILLLEFALMSFNLDLKK